MMFCPVRPAPGRGATVVAGRRLHVVLAVIGFVLAAEGRGGIQPEEQVRLLYSYFHVERAALAPDGKHVAFAAVSDNGFEIKVHDTDDADKKVLLYSAVPIASLDYLAWATATRIVAVTGDGVVLVGEPQNGRLHKLVDSGSFENTAGFLISRPKLRVLGFAAGDPDGLRLELSRKTTPAMVELHRVDLVTGRHERLFRESLGPGGGSLFMDWSGQVRLLFAGDRIPQRFLFWPEGGAKGAGRNLDDLLPDRTAFAFSVTPANLHGERTIPLGFGSDPQRLYCASNVGRDRYALESVNLATGRHDVLVPPGAADAVRLDAPWLQSPLVFDRTRGTLAGLRVGDPAVGAHWLDAEIAGIDAEVKRNFPGRGVELLEWDAARERFLVLVTGPDDPGRYFVHDRRTHRDTEYGRRLPDLDVNRLGRSQAFVIPAPTGGEVNLYLTTPVAVPGAALPPLVVWMHDGPWQDRPAGFNREAHAYAALGYALLEVDYAGSTGDGRARREVVRRSLDRIPLGEMFTALDVLGTRGLFDSRRVAVAGEGFGGYLALRALELQPDRFRCGIAINGLDEPTELWPEPVANHGAPVVDFGPARGENLDAMAAAGSADAIKNEAAIQQFVEAGSRSVDFERESGLWLARNSAWSGTVTAEAARLTRPVLLMQGKQTERSAREATGELRRVLKKFGHPPAYFALSPKVTRSAMTLRIDRFLKAELGPVP